MIRTYIEHLSTFQKRAASTTVMIAMLVLIFVVGDIALKILLFLLAGALTVEWVKICKLSLRETAFIMMLAVYGAMYAVLAGYPVLGFGLLFFSISLSILVSWFSWYRRFLWISLGLLYIGLPCFSALWLLEFVPFGKWVLLWVILVVSANDIAAYIIGNWLKGPKLIARLSPGKTWSGFVGGLATATLVGGLFYFLVQTSMSVQNFMKLSFVMALWACMGDLFESKIKRLHQIKDSGALIPGHGGVFDRLDGILFVLPLVALLFFFFPEVFSFIDK